MLPFFSQSCHLLDSQFGSQWDYFKEAVWKYHAQGPIQTALLPPGNYLYWFQSGYWTKPSASSWFFKWEKALYGSKPAHHFSMWAASVQINGVRYTVTLKHNLSTQVFVTCIVKTFFPQLCERTICIWETRQWQWLLEQDKSSHRIKWAEPGVMLPVSHNRHRPR